MIILAILAVVSILPPIVFKIFISLVTFPAPAVNYKFTAFPMRLWTAAAAAAASLQSCPTLCDLTHGSPPGSPIPGILQARTLEWVAISFSSAWKWKVKVKSFSHLRPSATPWTAAYKAPPSMGFSRQEYWSGVPLPSPGCELSWTILLLILNLPLLSSIKFDKAVLHFDQIRSVAQLCPTRCDPMNRSTPGLPVRHQLPEFTQTHSLSLLFLVGKRN